MLFQLKVFFVDCCHINENTVLFIPGGDKPLPYREGGF